MILKNQFKTSILWCLFTKIILKVTITVTTWFLSENFKKSERLILMFTLGCVKQMVVAPKRVQLQFDGLVQNLFLVSMLSFPSIILASHIDSCETICRDAGSSKPKYPKWMPWWMQKLTMLIMEKITYFKKF